MAHLSFIFAASNKNYGTMYKTAEEKKWILQHIQACGFLLLSEVKCQCCSAVVVR